MIITPHVLAGAALGTQISNPVLLAVYATISHHVLDMVPHWDYDILSSKKTGARKIAFDIALSGIVTFALIWNLPFQTQAHALWGGFWGILPDGFLALYLFSDKKYFPRYAQLHNFFHRLIIPKGHAPHFAIGLGTQIIAVLAALNVFISL
ncbi:hypothetical protein HY250_04290 [Candidatus Azambacteria bacterium]|nr:hypothetical protein [Candidatus Azambacteria bacterium]MBI3685597.1 hypothetical protein [Candidatus Azambacteria bacterium]